MWLNPERFLTDEFSAEECVADLRRFVPLATLQNELQSYLATLKTKMVEVINEDYADYVSLSTRLANVDGAVTRMRRPLMELKDKLVVVGDAVRAELAALSAGLRRRKEVATGRALLELMQDLAHVASKVEKLLAEVAAASKEGDEGDGVALAGGGSWGDLDARSRLLERVAGEVSRLSFQAQRGKDLAFVRAMEPRIAAARKEVCGHLATALAAALTGHAHAAALHCLHAYAELGESAPAEAALRQHVVAPVVERLVGEYKAAHNTRAKGGAGDDLGALLSRVLDAVSSELGPLLSAALTPQSPLRSLDILGGVVLAEVDGALGTHAPGVFSPGVPPAFHANYLAAQAFLDALERRCQGRTALERLRGGAAHASFVRRWNTSVYFSLVYQEIAGQLEDAVAGLAQHSPSAGGAAPPGHDKPAAFSAPLQGPARVRLPPSLALVEGLARCSDSSVFLVQLADRFLRLALQLGQRYISWAAAILAARRDAAAAAAAGNAPPTGLPLTPSPPGAIPGGAAGHDSTGGAGPAGASEGGAHTGSSSLAWVSSLPVADLAVLHYDVASTAAHVRDVFAPAFVSLISALPEEAREAAAAALTSLADAMQAQAGGLLGALCDEVAEGCVGVARQLKGITATYRMTTKGPPTRHSHYVTGVLAPLRAVLDSEHLAHGPGGASVAQQVALAVVETVSARYQALATELLATVRKTESSLKRLKKTSAAEGDGGAMSDSDKIGLQLYLDVQEYGAQVAKFGLQPDSLPGYQKLLASVVPSANPAHGGATPAGHGLGGATPHGSGMLPQAGSAPGSHASLASLAPGSSTPAPDSGSHTPGTATPLPPAITTADSGSAPGMPTAHAPHAHGPSLLGPGGAAAALGQLPSAGPSDTAAAAYSTHPAHEGSMSTLGGPQRPSATAGDAELL